MNEELNIDTTVFDEEYERQELERTLQQAEANRQAEAAKEEEKVTATPQPVQQQQKEEPEEPGGLFGTLNQFVEEETGRFENQMEEGLTTDNMSGRQRAVAGTVDTIMDLTSKFIPAMQAPADWWDEQTGRNVSKDPLKKAERNISAIVIPSLLGGFGISALGLKGLSAIGANVGLEAVISGTSDTTSEAGNLGSFGESVLQKVVPGAQIPWASRDTDSPDVVYWKNLTENLFFAGAASTLAELPTLLTYRNGGNKIIPKNEIAESIAPESPGTLQDAILRNQQKKRDAQLNIARKALAEDPDGIKGYNAFVNEPAEPIARATADESSNTVEFMADQARIQNNVDTVNGRARPLLDNDTQELLSRADTAARQRIMSKVSQELGAKFDLKVGSETLSSKQVTEAVNALYDAAIAPVGKTFDDAVRQFRDLELKVGNLQDTVSSRGGREIMGRTIDRLVDALHPETLRASAAVQTQTASGVSDLARVVDLNEAVVDTSRLQELMMPRLRTLLKEQATSQVSESMSTMLNKQLAQKTSTIEGALSLPDNYLDEMFDAYTKAVDEKAQVIDDFVDNLTEMAKSDPGFLRPVYRLYAKTNGEVDSMYKLNMLLNNKLGILRKAFVDGNPKVKSQILREMQSAVTSGMINGTAPAKAWVGNIAQLAVRPLTTLSGAVALGATTGNFKSLQRGLVAFGQFQETLRRASKMARDEWKFARSNPEAAMARGRADYNFADSNTDWKQTLADFEEMEELSKTPAFGAGRQAIWNMTKGLNVWNKKGLNTWGVHAMYSADGFLKSMTASMSSRFKAYDKLAADGIVFDKAKFRDLEKGFYAEAFDADGVLTDKFANYAAQEIALNADNEFVTGIEAIMDRVPIMKSIFRFPRTKANAISLIQTYDPTGALSRWSDNSFRTITANANDPAAVKHVLELHGMKGGNVDDFLMLKSEYIGRKLTTGSIVAGAAMMTVGGNLTGAGSYMTPAEKTRALGAGWRPYTIYGYSYENAPDWIKMSLGLTADITMAHFGIEGRAAEDWFGSMTEALAANVTNEFFGTEVTTLSDILSLSPAAIERYLASVVDTAIPGAGGRSALNDVLAPQLRDVENNFLGYLANRNRAFTQWWLEETIDPFTGNNINGNRFPLQRFIGRFLPFEHAGGDEPWRQWMLSTGWTGLSEPMVNPFTGEKLTPQQRQWVNRWIGENGNWDKEMERYMKMDDGELKREWMKLKGKRATLDLGKTEIHVILDESKKRQFDAAWNAYLAAHPESMDIKSIKETQDALTEQGDYDAAVEAAELIESMNQKYGY